MATNRWKRIAPQILYFLRTVQLGSICLTGFIAIVFIWLHTHHLCAYYPSYCSQLDPIVTKVPRGLVVLLVGCIISFLELYLSGANQIWRAEPDLNFLRLLISSSGSLLFFTIGFGSLWTVPNFSPYCYFTRNYPMTGPPEKRWCILTSDVTGTGLFVMYVSILVRVT
jgi:hypothetical protein